MEDAPPGGDFVEVGAGVCVALRIPNFRVTRKRSLSSSLSLSFSLPLSLSLALSLSLSLSLSLFVSLYKHICIYTSLFDGSVSCF